MLFHITIRFLKIRLDRGLELQPINKKRMINVYTTMCHIIEGLMGISFNNFITLSKDLQSSESYGERTFNPGQCAYQAAKHCECWAATPFAQPLGPLKTMGTFTTPPDMAYVLAAELMT